MLKNSGKSMLYFYLYGVCVACCRTFVTVLMALTSNVSMLTYNIIYTNLFTNNCNIM